MSTAPAFSDRQVSPMTSPLAPISADNMREMAADAQALKATTPPVSGAPARPRVQNSEVLELIESMSGSLGRVLKHCETMSEGAKELHGLANSVVSDHYVLIRYLAEERGIKSFTHDMDALLDMKTHILTAAKAIAKIADTAEALKSKRVS